MKEQLIGILYKSINGATLTDDEKSQLNEWLEQSHHNSKLYDEIMDSEVFRQDVKNALAYDNKLLWGKISRQISPPGQKNLLMSFFRRRVFWYAAAAALLISISTTAYILFVKPTTDMPTQASETQQAVAKDVLPGTEQAILTLDDGTELALNKISNGKIAQQGNTIIVKEDGLLAYNANTSKPSKTASFNTLTIPRGGYYSSLVLADGSKVWLNSESSIIYPTAFTDKERVVEIAGEIYFEVAKNASKPFKVKVKDRGMMVEVLGTHFNINAYNDETDIKTTLLEGLVKVSAKGKTSFLKPGQQASLNASNEIKVTDDANVEEVMAWKNGIFSFNKQDLETIMRQVSRWYGVDVVFEDKIPGHFVATVPRNVTVSKLLKIFETAGGVKFEIDEMNKKITVKH